MLQATLAPGPGLLRGARAIRAEAATLIAETKKTRAAV
jgi:hypothetical protein